MKDKLPWIAAALIALGLGLYAILGQSDDERVLNRRLDELAALTAELPGQSRLAIAASTQQIKRYFVAEPLVQPYPGSSTLAGLDQLQAGLALFASRGDAAQVSLSDRRLTIAEDRRSALHEVTATVRYSASGQTRREAARYQIEWTQRDGQWLIQTVQVIS